MCKTGNNVKSDNSDDCTVFHGDLGAVVTVDIKIKAENVNFDIFLLNIHNYLKH